MLGLSKINLTEDLFAWYKPYDLIFKKPAGTSRGVLTKKTSWFLFIKDKKTDVVGIGECGPLPGLSSELNYGLEEKLKEVVEESSLCLHYLKYGLEEYPSVRFALETALLDLQGGGKRLLFENDFTSTVKGIPINGLIWMGSAENMHNQMEQKLADAYSCIKMKIGAIDFQKEIELLRKIRSSFDKSKIILRVDANGAFSSDCDKKLYELSKLDIHSIEQPIKQGQISKMSALCRSAPLDIALDEELIGIHGKEAKKELLEKINPQFIIIKPSLLGGFEASMEWINIAESKQIGWWVTSALESNIGLNAIAQWTYELGVKMHQGLGTGQLYTNNIDSPLYIDKGHLYYGEQNKWDLKPLL